MFAVDTHTDVQEDGQGVLHTAAGHQEFPIFSSKYALSADQTKLKRAVKLKQRAPSFKQQFKKTSLC